MTNTKLTVLALALSVAGVANASPFYINAGSYGTTTAPAPYDSNTQTTSLNSLGWTDSVATSIYLGLAPGSTVIDTNSDVELAKYGIAPVVSPDQRQISELNAVGSLGDAENFINTPIDWGSSSKGGSYWGMTYTYTLLGKINAAGTGVDFNSGYFDLFFEDGTTSKQVLRLNLSSFALVSGSAALYTVLANGTASFDWTGGPGGAPDGNSDADSFAQSFFNDTATGKTFYESWFNNGTVNPIAISWRMDNNIDCPDGTTSDCSGVPLASQLAPAVENGNVVGGYRQTTIDGTVRFAVPEPASVALLGIGLLGLGLSRKGKKSNA